MSPTASKPAKDAATDSPWEGFRGALWQKEINVRAFIQLNYTPYEGDASFLAPATARTKQIWDTLTALFVEERKKGVLDISQIPASITAHGPGYIDRDREIIVGLQTDAPLKRAIMPNGGLRMVLSALEAYGYTPDPHMVEAFTKYRKTHNEGVFDAYTADIRACRSSHVLTGLPDAYGRGRIIGDYRRVALYGVDRLIARKKQEKLALDPEPSTEEIIRDREELSEQIRSLQELKAMAASYGFDISGPARTAREAVQWLYFGYLAAVKEQNGAAMSLGRCSTFLDIYFERDLKAGRLTEEQAQEIIDDFVIKLRIVRFLRTPEYDELFAGDPTWVTESIGGMGDDGRSLVTKTSFRMLQTLYNLGPAPEPNLTIWYSARMPDGFRKFASKVAIDTSSLQFESDEIMRRTWGDDGAIACCVSPMLVGKQMQFFGARANLAKCLLYAINGGRDEMSGKQVGPASEPVKGEYLDFDEVVERFDKMMDWLAGVYVNAMNVIHYMHDKYAYERLEMALHDYAPLRTMAFGMAGLSVVADSLSAIKYARVKVIRDKTGLDHRLPDRRRVPGVRQQRQPRGPDRQLSREHVHGQAAEASDVPERPAHAVDPDHHVERRVREGDRQHAGRPAAGRAVRARRQSDARARQPRHSRGRGVGGEDSVPRRGGRHFADGHAGADRTRPDCRGSDHEPHRHAGCLLQRHRLPHERQRPEPGHAARRDGSSGEVSEPDDSRLGLRGEFRAAHARAADGRHQPHLPRRHPCLTRRPCRSRRRARSSSGSIWATPFPSRAFAKRWPAATWGSCTPTRPAPPSMARACASWRGRRAACGAASTATTPTRGR